MEVKIEQTIKLKFGEVEVILSKEDAEKLYDNLADALGYEEKEDKIVYIPYNTNPYIPPTRITWPEYPYWRWNDPYIITSGYSQLNDTGTTSIYDAKVSSVTTSVNI